MRSIHDRDQSTDVYKHMKKVLTIISKTIYGTVVLAVVAMALLFIGTKVDVLGYELRVVKSGSMEPAIPTGSLVLITPAESYEVGDVVTYHTGAAGSIPVTHRIMRKTVGEQQTYYATQGDANEDMDPSPVPHPRVIGRVSQHLPFIGYAIEFARTPLGFALLIGIPAAMIILDEFANIIWEYRKYRFAKRKNPTNLAKGDPRHDEVTKEKPLPLQTLERAAVREETQVSFAPKSVTQKKERVTAAHAQKERQTKAFDMVSDYSYKRRSI